MSWTNWVFTGSIFGALSVVFGAFASHALKFKLSPDALSIFEVGVRYQMYHSLALVFLGIVATRVDSSLITASGFCFLIGILMFSGSLYALTLSEYKFLGLITPLGGLLLVSGWGCLALAMAKL